MEDNPLIDQLCFARLDEAVQIGRFTCHNGDLEKFLKDDARDYQRAALAVTYLCLLGREIVAYVTLAADSIKLDESEKSGIPENKARLREYPAIKIARLAVTDTRLHQGIGRHALQKSIGKIIGLGGHIGCRFATVDALPESEKFYEKMGFNRNLHKQERGRSTISMRYDLLHYPC